jgi:hypothetical protein
MVKNPLEITLSTEESAMITSHATKMGMSAEQVVHVALKLYDALESMSETHQKSRNKKKCCNTCTCDKIK